MRLNRWVHGKQFWLERVVPCLNRLLGQQKSADDRRSQIWAEIEVPADWQDIWKRISS